MEGSFAAIAIAQLLSVVPGLSLFSPPDGFSLMHSLIVRMCWRPSITHPAPAHAQTPGTVLHSCFCCLPSRLFYRGCWCNVLILPSQYGRVTVVPGGVCSCSVICWPFQPRWASRHGGSTMVRYWCCYNPVNHWSRMGCHWWKAQIFNVGPRQLNHCCCLTICLIG